MNNKLSDAFLITNFIDTARWSSKDNYSLINFYDSSIPDDEKLLVHWLCYITDRQMPFDRIWSIGGFIFSQIVHSIHQQYVNQHKDFLSLLNPNKDTSYFIKRRDFSHRNDHFNEREYDKYLFVSKEKVNENQRLKDYGFAPDQTPYFIPRFYPSDYKAILCTYNILKNYDNSLITYIIRRLDKFLDDKQLIPKLLFSLFLLTYYKIGQPKANDIDNFIEFNNKIEDRVNKVRDILEDDKKFNNEFDKFKKDEIYTQKRAWCSLRDFFKSPEFKAYFIGALQHKNPPNIDMFNKMLNENKLLHSFELPGDIWNNNLKFRRCILKNISYENHEDKNLSINIILRKIYENNKKNISVGYPEQFDITFDFVPRMCVLGNCNICPYGLLNGNASEFDKICIRDNNKYCTVVLASCGYKYDCDVNKCSLLLEIKNRYVNSSKSS